MGVVGARVEAVVEGLRDTVWPEGERVVAWANAAGDDPRAAWAGCERADDLLALAAAAGVAPGAGLVHVASLVREASRIAGQRDPRIARVAFAAEQASQGSRAARMKLLDDAKSLMASAEQSATLGAKQTILARAISARVAVEVLRATAFLALALVTADAAPSAYANLAHAIRQTAAASATLGLGSGDKALSPSNGEKPEQLKKRLDGALEPASVEELVRLGTKLRAALAPDFERAAAAAFA